MRKTLRKLRNTVINCLVRWNPIGMNPFRAIYQIKVDLVMPKHFYHHPMDGLMESHPPVYAPSITVAGEPLPVPPPDVRPGYSPDNDIHYLDWGKSDHDFIVDLIKKHGNYGPDLAILDWGCSSGRVLRHFYAEHGKLNWALFGIDIQAFQIEWMRQNFPSTFSVISGTAFPHLPYKDNSIDIIYGISVFTHTKYLWDFWLMELKRVLKPGGLCILTVQCEEAWEFYHQHRNEPWVQGGHPRSMLEKPHLTQDYFLYGDGVVSQNFFKEECLKRYYGRIMSVVDFLPPAAKVDYQGYQNWVVLRA